MVKDPVCGMQLDEKTAPSSTYMGQKYFFCSPGCQSAFEKDPAKYLGKEGSPPGERHMGH